MASRAIREVQALNIVAQELSNDIGVEKLNYASIETLEDLDKIEAEQPWVLNQVSYFFMYQLLIRTNSGRMYVNVTK